MKGEERENSVKEKPALLVRLFKLPVRRPLLAGTFIHANRCFPHHGEESIM